jgi:hypothetical protein
LDLFLKAKKNYFEKEIGLNFIKILDVEFCTNEKLLEVGD